MDVDPTDVTPQRDTGSSVRSRATTAVGTFGLGGLVAQGLSFLGVLVLAHFVDPYDFGVVAFGTTLISSVQLFADGGLGVALIREPGEVGRPQLEAVMGAQLIASTIIALVVAATAVGFGTAGVATAVMVAAVPIIAWRSPGSVRVERELRYRPLVIVSIAEVIGYYAWAIPGVLLGFNVWALATGVVFRALVGTLTQEWLLRDYPLWPRLDWKRVRPLLGFGSQFVAAGGAVFLRDQGLNFGISWAGGLSMLGFWSFANRLIQPINLVYSTLWRVTYPTMSRLREIEEDPTPVLERISQFVAVLSAVAFVPLIVCSQALVTAFFGAKWSDVSEILPGLCAGLLVGGPCSTALTGHLLASGDAKTPRNAVLVQFAVSLVVTLPLLHLIGAWGLGLGSGIGSLADAVVLVRATRRTTPFSLRPLAIPSLCAFVAGAPFWLAVVLWKPQPAYEFAAGVASLALLLGLLWLLDGGALRGTFRLAVRSSLAAVRGQAVPTG